MTRLVGRPVGGPPRYAYTALPGVPPVSVLRVGPGMLAAAEPGHAHTHDFPLLAYFEDGGGSLRLAGREWPIAAGDVFLAAPGEVLGAGHDREGLRTAQGWAVYFLPEAVEARSPGALLHWRAHPLLLPFVRGAASGAHHLWVPVQERDAWSRRCQALDEELRGRRDGYTEAALAHLTLVLVDVARRAADVAGQRRVAREPLLAAVFDVVEARYREPISLRDVARALGLTPGHLTTVVRRRTGRTVQEWLTERRMAEARRLLAASDLPVAVLAGRTGYTDPSYFVRVFRRTHGVTPLAWRRAARDQPGGP